MNLRISLTVATLAASLLMASPASARHEGGKSITTKASTSATNILKNQTRVNRMVTWHWQNLVGVHKTRTRYAERKTRSVPFLRYLVHWWHKQAYDAMRAYHRQQERAAVHTLSYGGSPRAIGQAMAARYGWVGSEWAALDELWGAHESGWSTTAHNPGSDACGIPQAMNNCSYGYDPATQIAWGLSYIKGRYKTPSRALAHWYAVSWY